LRFELIGSLVGCFWDPVEQSSKATIHETAPATLRLALAGRVRRILGCLKRHSSGGIDREVGKAYAFCRRGTMISEISRP
jgi:hypothetical protein